MKTMRMNAAVLLLGGILVVLGAAAPAAAEILVEVVSPAQWGASDSDIGLAGGIVEDFEDLTLAAGLEVEISDAGGNFSCTGWTVLPNVFDPVAGDPFGDSFAQGVWDGSKVLVNTANNQSQTYGSADWRPVALRVPGGADWIAVACQQVTINHVLFVNGIARDRVGNYGLAVGPGRNGVLVVRSTDPTEPVVSISFGGRGDAFVLDHVVFSDTPAVSSRAAAWSGVKALYR
jgi:hypothetical protein